MEIKQKEIIYIPISDLIPADYNPRTLSEKQYSDLKRSIEKYGIVQPLIINNHLEHKNKVIGGHQRLRVAKDLGYETVPCIYETWDGGDEKHLNLILNKTGGSWDYDSLANHFNTDMLFDVGFTEFDLGLVTPTVNNADMEWEDMPMVNEEKIEGVFKTMIVHIQTEEDYERFKDIMQQDMTEKTKTIFFPYKKKEVVIDKVIISENV